MKTEKVLETMGHIDPALVEEMDGMKKRKRRLPILARAGVVAACLCLMLMGTAVAVEQITGVSIKEFISETYGEHTIGGVDLSIMGITVWPQEQFGRQMVQDLREEDGKIVLEPKMEFDSWSEAKDYMNLPLADNPLFEEGRKAGQIYRLNLYNMATRIVSGSLVCNSNVDGVDVQLRVDFYGETDMTSEKTDGGYRYGGETFTLKNEEYEMDCGACALVIFTELDGRFGCDAIFVQDGLLYSLRFWDEEKPISRSVVHKALDAFEAS